MYISYITQCISFAVTVSLQEHVGKVERQAGSQAGNSPLTINRTQLLMISINHYHNSIAQCTLYSMIKCTLYTVHCTSNHSVHRYIDMNQYAYNLLSPSTNITNTTFIAVLLI